MVDVIPRPKIVVHGWLRQAFPQRFVVAGQCSPTREEPLWILALGPGRRQHMDHEAIARRCRHQAEEFRAKSDLMQDEITRDQYKKIADSYDGLADREEKLARP